MGRELESYLMQLNSEIRDRVDDADTQNGGSKGGSPYSEEIFTEIVLDFLAEVGMIENSELCFHEGTAGRGRVKLSGFAFNDEDDRLDIITTVRLGVNTPTTIGKEEIVKAAKQATRFVEASFGGIYERMEQSSEAASLAKRIYDLESTVSQVRIFVLTDCLSTVKELKQETLGRKNVRYEIWDLERLYRGMQAGLPRDEIDINFEERYGEPLACLPVPNAGADFSAYLAVFPGEVLYDLYEEFGPRLLELNVRSFLSARGKVNSGIRKTLRDEPDRFMAYNNGIVVTVDDLQLTNLVDGRPAIGSVKGLQIVNGGQTTASIHRARKTDRSDVSSVLVPAKLTVIRSEKLDEIVRMISHYANTQNTIQPADFSANEPFHVEIERISKVIWCPDHRGRWFYERARGQYQVAKAKDSTTRTRARKFNEQTPTARKFTKTDLAKFENAWNQKPHIVSRGAQKNFDEFMQNLRNARSDHWLPDDAYYRHSIAKGILFRATQKIVRAEKFPAHQANIIAYTVAYLSWRTGGHLDLDWIWQNQSISQSLSELVRVWARNIDHFLRDTSAGRMVTEWAKKEQCWQTLKTIEFVMPDALPPEMKNRTVYKKSTDGAASPVAEQLTPDDYRNIEACKALDGEEWLKIHAWGKQSGSLKFWQIGIALTLAGYAANGWERGPSPKQARHGAAIVQLARENGILRHAPN